jgi:hypothetical protein
MISGLHGGSRSGFFQNPVKDLGFIDVRKNMDSTSNIQPLLAPKDSASIAGRAIASFGAEIDQLLAMTLEAAIPPAGLGANVDIKA